jgi:hypothetical protein
MTHSLSIRVAETCLRSRSTLPLLAAGRWVFLSKEMFGTVEQAIRQRVVRATCMRIGELD